MNCRVIEPNDLPRLKDLWLSCFDEKEQAAELFFKRTLSYTHGYAAEENGVLIASVYLIDCQLCGKQAHYLCGAATLPEYRKRGVMSGLIRFALDDAKSRGDCFSVLLPANRDLYEFYGRLGYLPLGRAYRTEIDTEPGSFEPGKPDLQALQQACDNNKFLLWNNNHIAFACEYYFCYGAEIASGKNAFALYEPDGEVFYAIYNSKKELKHLLYSKGMRRVTLWSGSGESPVKQGMIKPLSDAELPDEFYIGLSLQ